MKKALSLFLAVLMIFAAMSVSASAVSTVPENEWFGTGAAANTNQAILSFDLNGGTLKNGAWVYNIDSGKLVWEDTISGTYNMIPMGDYHMTAGTAVTLPTVTAPTGYQFDGWYCYDDGRTYAANAPFDITDTMTGTFTHFRAAYSPAELEEDTLTKIMGILIQVFGAILGLIMFAGDTSAGIEMMQKVLGGLIG